MMKPLALALLLAACSRPAPTPDVHAGEPWNGGKQAPAFAITAAVHDSVAVNQALALPVAITPGRDCSQLAITVRGIDGVIVEPANARAAFATCTRGAAIAHTATVRVPAGVAGYAVVDVRATVDGQPTSATYSIPLRDGTTAFAHETLGEVTTDSNGKPIVRMIAH